MSIPPRDPCTTQPRLFKEIERARSTVARRNAQKASPTLQLETRHTTESTPRVQPSSWGAEVGDLTSAVLHTRQVAVPMVERLSLEETSHRLIQCAEADLSPTAYRIYSALHLTALHVSQDRDYHPSVSRVTFHCPAEIVAAALGIHRTTLWRNLRELQELGLVEARAHKSTLRGETRNDGTLWCVKLHPTRGKSARLTYEELKHKWRDLDGDTKRGRTAYGVLKKRVQQSKEPTSKRVDTELLLAWALPPRADGSPSTLTVARGARVDLESVLDVPFADREHRNEAVDTAARAVCQALGDSSVDFYRKLLWNLLRRRDQGRDYFGTVYEMMRRARVDQHEGFAKNAGALLVSRLKRWAVWDELERTPLTRVGMPPC